MPGKTFIQSFPKIVSQLTLALVLLCPWLAANAAIATSATPVFGFVSAGSTSLTSPSMSGVDVGDGIIIGTLYDSHTLSASLTGVACNNGGTPESATLVTPKRTSAAWAFSEIYQFQFAYIPSTTLSGTITCVGSLDNSYGDVGIVFVMAVNGHDNTSAFFDGGSWTTLATGAGTSSTVNVTTAAANELVLSLCETQDFSSGAPTSSWGTILTSSLLYNPSVVYVLDNGAAGTKTPAVTQPASTNWACVGIAFKAAAGAAASVFNPISGRGGAAAQPVVH